MKCEENPYNLPLRIGVVGSFVSQVPDIERIVECLGEEIANEGQILVFDARNYIDRQDLMRGSFPDILSTSAQRCRGNTVEVCGAGGELVGTVTDACEAVICVGGGDETQREYEVARQLFIPVIGVEGTGGIIDTLLKQKDYANLFDTSDPIEAVSIAIREGTKYRDELQRERAICSKLSSTHSYRSGGKSINTVINEIIERVETLKRIGKYVDPKASCDISLEDIEFMKRRGFGGE